MAASFLFANIGNRNLLFDGKYFDQSVNKGLSFTEFTKQCYNKENEVLVSSSDILIPTLDEYKDKISTLYLIGSNQTDCLNAKIDQDTIWAALLLKKILNEKYSFKIEVVECKVFATDVNALIVFYLKLLKKLFNENNEIKLMLLDVGGTSQQKTALRKSCEFLFSQEDLTIINKNIHQNTVNIVASDISKDLLTLEQVISLCYNGQFNSALFLVSNLNNLNVPFLDSILKFCHLRFIQLSTDAFDYCTEKTIGNAFATKFTKDYQSRLNGSEPFFDFITNREVRDNDYLRKMSFEIGELFHLVRWHWYIEDLTSFVLSLQQFIESVINCLVTCYTGHRVYTEYAKAGNKLLDTIDMKYPKIHKILQNHFENTRIQLSLPSMIIIAETLVLEDDKELAGFFADLRRIIKSIAGNDNMIGIDTLRNAIAHEGRGITINHLSLVLSSDEEDKFVPWGELIQRWQKIFGFPKESVYNSMSEWIEKYIKQVNFNFTV